MNTAWQRSLRLSEHSGAEIVTKPAEGKVLKRTRLPSVVEEGQDDQNKRRRKSTATFLPEDCNPAQEKKRRKRFPVNLLKKKESINPVCIPPDVEDIDADDNNNRNSYGADIMIYLRQKEKLFNEAINRGSSQIISMDNRNHLVNWLLELLHLHKTSQVTVYLSINLLDLSISLMQVGSARLQLLGITCVWIATKLEEYFPADLQRLVDCTSNAFTAKAVLAMERSIYRGLNFTCFGEEPTSFVERLIQASKKQEDEFFRELCMLLLDLLVADFEEWKKLASLKSAAAVYTALYFVEQCSSLWSPTMVFYSGYEEMDLVSLSLVMMKKLAKVIHFIHELEKKSIKSKRDNLGDLSSILNKYLSRSRHMSIILNDRLSEANVMKVLERVKKRSEDVLKDF